MSARSSCRSSTPRWLTGWAWTRSACASTPGPADRAIALEHNGDVYSCDHYVEDGYLLGNIADGRTLLELVTSPGQVAFGNAKLDTLPEYCRRCDVRFACNGGCPKDRFISTPDGDPGPNYLCAGYQRVFRHIDEPMRIMADLLRHDRDAAAIRDWHTDGDLRASSRPDDAGDPARRAR